MTIVLVVTRSGTLSWLSRTGIDLLPRPGYWASGRVLWAGLDPFAAFALCVLFACFLLVFVVRGDNGGVCCPLLLLLFAPR